MPNAYFKDAVKTEKGLQFKGRNLQPIAEKCNGCERIADFDNEKYCMSYPDPTRKWARGTCNFATHVKGSLAKSGRVKINPLKASKRAAKNK